MVIDELLSVWWTLIPIVVLLLLALWELSRQRKRANEERIRRLEEEVERLKKENK